MARKNLTPEEINDLGKSQVEKFRARYAEGSATQKGASARTRVKSRQTMRLRQVNTPQPLPQPELKQEKKGGDAFHLARRRF